MPDFALNEDQLQIQKWVHDFAVDVIRPAGHEWDEREEFPYPIVQQAAEIGLYGWEFLMNAMGDTSGLTLPVAVEELFWGDAGIGMAIMGSALAAAGISGNGTPEQVMEWVPQCYGTPEKIALGAFCVSEPDAGSDVSSLRTKAVYDQATDEWVLNGTKAWITNGGIADVSVVWARTPHGIQGFLVEKGTPGFSTSDLHGKMSMRASVTSSLAFQDCRISASHILPQAKGLKAALQCLNQARYGIGWGVIGAAIDCYETARQYCVTRRQFDNKPIASHQLVQEKLAWMVTEISKAQLLALHCGRLKDAGRLKPEQVSMLKRHNVAIALECARISRDLLGANGIMEDYPVMRHMANLESVKTYEGTDHIHALVIGEAVTGIPAYR